MIYRNYEIYDEIVEYVELLHNIADYKYVAEDISTPYAFEVNRAELHEKLFRNQILPRCHPVDGFTEDDMYARTKELFANLDKIWRIYDLTEFDLKDESCICFLCKYLQRFLFCTETLYFIEGRTTYIHGIHI